MTRWDEIANAPGGEAYAARFAALAASGVDVHGEAAFCAALVDSPAAVLDAGCGTGRVAIELVRRGYSCVGVDVSPTMLTAARSQAPDLVWVEADLATLNLGSTFDLVVSAGNVIPLLAPGTEREAVRRLAAHLAPEGMLVVGFGLDAAHLPLTQAPFGIDAYDDWCADAGLQLVQRFATWSGDPFDSSDRGYAVSVHALTARA